MLKGKAFKFGDNISTDLIVPGRLAGLRSNLPELAKHVLEDADPTFASKVKPGDFVVGGSNFGLGSSREHAPLALKGAGVSVVIAKSFARIFYRNSFNTGLPILVAPEAVDGIVEGDELTVDLASGRIEDLTSGKTFQAQPLPPFMRELVEAGGLLPYLKARSAAR